MVKSGKSQSYADTRATLILRVGIKSHFIRKSTQCFANVIDGVNFRSYLGKHSDWASPSNERMRRFDSLKGHSSAPLCKLLYASRPIISEMERVGVTGLFLSPYCPHNPPPKWFCVILIKKKKPRLITL